jgi:hypothetical protein
MKYLLIILAYLCLGFDTIGWRAVTASGNNKQPVFDMARIKMNALLAISDIPFVTMSAGETLFPATKTELATAIKEQGAKARGCFVYLTSHGSEQDGITFGGINDTLDPKELDAMLDAGCGTKPQLIIVSSCHSGIFYNEKVMQKPWRVILTSAAPNRDSWYNGSGEVFDNCLVKAFEEGTAQNWHQVMAQVQECVSFTEDIFGVKHSKPDGFQGSMASDELFPQLLPNQ